MISKLSFLIGMSQFKIGMTISIIISVSILSIIISVSILIDYLFQYFRAKAWQDYCTIERCRRKLVGNFVLILLKLLSIWIIPTLVTKGILSEKIGLALAFILIPTFFYSNVRLNATP